MHERRPTHWRETISSTPGWLHHEPRMLPHQPEGMPNSANFTLRTVAPSAQYSCAPGVGRDSNAKAQPAVKVGCPGGGGGGGDGKVRT